MTEEATIRTAQPCDCGELLAMIRDHARFEGGEATVSAIRLMHLLAGPDSEVSLFVASLPDRLLGYAAMTFDFSLWRGTRWAHLDCLFVRPDARGAGQGGRLLHHAARISRERGADRLEWQTPAWNEPAIAFYRRQGAVGQDKLRFALRLTLDAGPDAGDLPAGAIAAIRPSG